MHPDDDPQLSFLAGSGPSPTADRLPLDLTGLPPSLRVGTSSFSSDDWRGSLYPENARPGEYLIHYARQLPTVEIDATFYAEPAPRTVDGWAKKTLEDFIIAAKVPKVITHDRALERCVAEFSAFYRVMGRLGEKRGPLLFQFPYVSRRRNPEEHASGARFRERLDRFLTDLPADDGYVVEVRNAAWIDDPLLEILTRHGVALALTHYSTMPSPAEVMGRVKTLPGVLAYVRFLGDHRKMDRLVADAMTSGTRDREWGELLVDRSQEMAATIPVLQDILADQRHVYVYFNNHYAGYAPGSIDEFARLWRELVSRGARE